MNVKLNIKIIALAVAALAAAAMPNTAEARCRGCAVGAGVVGGLAIGAILGSAIANGSPRYAEPEPIYESPPSAVYYNDADAPICHTERRRFWNGQRWQHRRVEICE